MAQIQHVNIILDGNKPHILFSEFPEQHIASIQIISAESGQVFYDNAVYLASFDLLHHLLVGRTVKIQTSPAVVDLDGAQFNVFKPADMIHNN